ncbi:sn-glycerol 3-phosphate transport system substrate-binding protein [Bacillus horti]|uniref:Sn-glycerol 3-phosphate transport system substrate-binding protein n=2 Tax=Caldalkalibacillus horti TaxID=77523 RepID=A0ABT9VZH7_9BACI|nr:sn-glycerol 3-phosphate transport system substrate-binding protein [Bacillus horti]
MKKAIIVLVLFTLALAGCSTGSSSQSGQVELEFYFPVAVGGPITKIVDDMVAEFHEQHEDIKVTPIFAGSYAETMTKVLTAVQGNNSPDLGVLFSIDLHTLLSLDAIEKLNPHFEQSYLNDFFPGFMSNSQIGEDVWSIPFQRSTIVLYYNKDAFREAGLDPEQPPTNWDELLAYSEQLTENGRWGLEIPSTGYQYWMFQALALQASGGQNIMSADGTEVYFDTPENLEALEFYVDLGSKHNVMPQGIIEWATVPSDFISGNTAMMFHTTGNLTRVKEEADFEFGVAYLPAKKDHGTPTGGGNIYMFKDIPDENKEAAVKFIEFLTEPARVAQWSMDTGYVATRQSAYDTDELQSYVDEFPEAKVALDQLEYADSELSTFENGRVQKILNDALQAALTGSISPEEALKRAQNEADEVLKSYQD